jgi:23S rRNA pseudouridine2605 synthase
MIRLQKAIADAGVCSRRKAEELIVHGHVRVNGEIAKIGTEVDPLKDKILVMGRPVVAQKKIYLMLNKPRGYLTTAADPYGRKHVLSLIHESQRVFPVGRLDRDTTGLLILTNDGEFANRIMHPRYEVTKTYEATLDDRIDDAALKRINDGIVLDGRRIQATATKLAPKRVRITIHTGLNKEVKRLLKQVGSWVVALQRTEIQGVRMTVKEGKYRHLTASEIARLTQAGRSSRPARA